jgi:hypothetical protein
MIRPTKLLPILFIFTGLIAYVDRTFNEEMARLTGIRESFTEAIGDTRARLMANAWSALSDQQIQQNFELGNMNTVTQSIHGYIRPGEVSQLDLYDANCDLLSRAPQNGKSLKDICTTIKSGKPSLLWDINEQNEAVLVAVAVRQVSGRDLYAATQLVLDQTWLSLYHELATLAADRKISLGSSGGAELWREGRLNDGRYALVLRVDGWFYRLVPELTGLALIPLRENFWIVFGALGVLLVLALSEISAKSRKAEKERHLVQTWLSEQSAFKNPGGGSSGGDNIEGRWPDLLVTMKSLVSSKEEQRVQQLRLMSERLDGATTRLRERESELSELRRAVAEMSGLASLQQQLKHTTSSFLLQMSEMRELSETIHDLVQDGLVRHAKELGNFVERWNCGLSQGINREMAARKFFRSLVEAPGRVAGNSQLDDDMNQLSSITSETIDQALHTAMLARKVMEGCDSASQLTSLWHGIANRDDSEKSSDWIDCLVTAQRLVLADERYQALSFETLPQIENPNQFYPLVSKSALVSGFFHMYLALLANVDPDKMSQPIVVRQKRLKDQATIILALPAKQATVAPKKPDRKFVYHIDIARQIMGTCGLKVLVLPPTSTGLPVGISWELSKDLPVQPMGRAVVEKSCVSTDMIG